MTKKRFFKRFNYKKTRYEVHLVFNYSGIPILRLKRNLAYEIGDDIAAFDILKQTQGKLLMVQHVQVIREIGVSL